MNRLGDSELARINREDRREKECDRNEYGQVISSNSYPTVRHKHAKIDNGENFHERQAE